MVEKGKKGIFYGLVSLVAAIMLLSGSIIFQVPVFAEESRGLYSAASENEAPGGEVGATSENEAPGGEVGAASENEAPGGEVGAASENEAPGGEVGAASENEAPGKEGDASLEESGKDSAEKRQIQLELYDEDKLLDTRIIDRTSVSCNLPLTEKTGYELEGFYYRNTLILMPDGSVSKQTEQLFDAAQKEDIIQIKAKWSARTYLILYGEDLDGDGIPDERMTVTYGEAYPGLMPMADKGLRVFKGYYFEGKRLFDRKGQPEGKWKWDFEGDILLKAGYYRPEGTDLPGKETNPEDSPVSAAVKEESALLQEEQAEEHMEVQGSVERKEAQAGEHMEVQVAGKKKEAQAEEHMEVQGAVERKEAQAEEHMEVQGAGKTKEAQAEKILERQHSREELAGQRAAEKAERPEETRTAREAQRQPEETIKGTEQTRVASLEEQKPRYTAVNRWKELPAAQKAALSAGLVTSIIVIVILIMSLWMLAHAAVLFADDENGRRKRIAFLLLLMEKDSYVLTIKQRLLDNGSTGVYYLHFPRNFVRRHRNETVMIVLPDRRWTELIVKEIRFLA